MQLTPEMNLILYTGFSLIVVNYHWKNTGFGLAFVCSLGLLFFFAHSVNEHDYMLSLTLALILMLNFALLREG